MDLSCKTSTDDILHRTRAVRFGQPKLYLSVHELDVAIDCTLADHQSVDDLSIR
jgi:hypothetical protein